MKTASIRQIRNKFPSVLRMVQNGETVAITSRRKIVATLTPPPKQAPAKRPWADLDERFAGPPNRSLNTAELISGDRDR
jgi:antitoxin (DNA-binding transcriptional repressor) of toxin-antitoxin stability system